MSSRSSNAARRVRACVAAILFALSALLGLARQSSASEHVGTSRAALTKGMEASPESPATVALTSPGGGGEVYCSGTLIGPRLVLTAAHCLGGGDSPDIIIGVETASGVRIRSRRYVVHPEFDERSLAHDVGVIELASTVSAVPVRLATPDKHRLLAGATLRVMGFGRAALDGGSGQKREGRVVVLAETGGALELTPGPALPCVGDSGGSVFVEEEPGKEVLLGVISYGDQACAEKAFAIRVDAERAFIENAIDESLPDANSDDRNSAGCGLAPLKGPPHSRAGGVLGLGLTIVFVQRRRVRSTQKEQRSNDTRRNTSSTQPKCSPKSRASAKSSAIRESSLTSTPSTYTALTASSSAFG